jgi:ribulose-bisphosphate carboxylase large chain
MISLTAPDSQRIYAKYLIETAYPLEEAAEIMAGEQSSGTFVRVPGETDELRTTHAAVVEGITELESCDAPSLPGARVPGSKPGPYRRAEVLISWPLSNLGPSLPNVMATVAGNLFELSPFSGLRLLDLHLPDAFLDRYNGPQFGVAGTRRLAGVPKLPLVGTIVKPSVGLTAEQTASLVEQLVQGGIDFIKDDELQADGPHCPFRERVDAVMSVIHAAADRTGRKVMFAFNITGEIEDMLRNHDYVAAAGGTCVMVSLNSMGLPAVAHLRRYTRLPIHGHRNGWGMLSRSPALGMSYLAYQKFYRIAGVDHMHVNGIRNKFTESDDSVIASARECLTPMFARPGNGCEIMPVFSSGQWAGQADETWRRLRSTDLIYACGGGIMAHPRGVEAGVKSIRQAWEAAITGVPFEKAAQTHVELREAAAKFGK